MGMKVAILGGGNGARTMAADFASRGMSVRLWEDPRFYKDLGEFAYTKRQKIYGVINASVELEMVTCDIQEALEGVEFVCVVVPAFAYESIAKTIRGVIKKEQVLISYPGAFASLVFKKELGEDCPDVLVDFCNLPYGTRVMPDGRIHCTVINDVNCAFFPAAAEKEWLEKINLLHPVQRTYTDVIENGLNIINPAAHLGSCLFNVAQVEQKFRGPFWGTAHHSLSCAAVCVAVDKERDLIGRKMGYPKNTCFNEFYGKPMDFEWTRDDYYRTKHGLIFNDIRPGPDTIYHRYYTEDCGYGLVPWWHLAKAAGVEIPIIDSAITIYSLIHHKNWLEEGRTLQDMGLEDMTIEEMRTYARTGIKQQ